MSRPATANIRLDAFRHNYRVAIESHGGKSLAVVKANAYGHGAVQCAKAIADEADGFAVACLEEALQLRQAGIENPILLLEGFFEAAELPEIVFNDFMMVIHAQWQLDILLAEKLAKPVQVWLKMDSGMHRVGLAPSEYLSAFTRLNAHENVAKITLMTHFANADNIASNHTNQQVNAFQSIIDLLGHTNKLETADKVNGTSLANSAAILVWPQSHCFGYLSCWSRPGIMLYGANPIAETTKEKTLQAVMQLTTKIISIRQVAKGQSIGYGSIFTAARDTLVGVAAIGYADGYPRSATGAPVAVDGVTTRVIGRVSMDMLFVDLTDIPTAKIGSHVELWGDQIAANDVATAANTIAYELFCNVKRVHFQYSDN
jgi:alanine racemase